MTLRELIDQAAANPWWLAAFFLLPPLAAWFCGLLHGTGRGSANPWPLVYSVLLYLACVPGMFAAVLTAYSLFFLRENLLDVNLLVYVLPIGSMLATLVLVRRQVRFESLPGIDRLWGMLLLLGISFAVALAIQKTNLWVFFGGSIAQLLVLALAVFVLGKWATRAVFGGRGTARDR